MKKLLFWSEASKILIYFENIGWDFQLNEKQLDAQIPLNFNSIYVPLRSQANTFNWTVLHNNLMVLFWYTLRQFPLCSVEVLSNQHL